MPTAEARAFSQDQWPPQQPLTPEQQEAFEREFEKLLVEHQARPVDNDAVAREMAERRARVGRLMSWLEMCPDAPKRVGEGGLYRVSNAPPAYPS